MKIKVYRYLSESELNKILNGNVGELGNSFHTKKIIERKYRMKINSHNYNPKEKYLHFFKKLSDIEFIRQERRNYEENHYFAEFEIPALVLFFAAGKGYYNTLSGYETFIEDVTEYAVNAKHFNPSWLVSYTLDKNKQEFMHPEAYDRLKFQPTPQK